MYSLKRQIIYLQLYLVIYTLLRVRACFLNDKWPIFAQEDLAAPFF